MLPCCSPPEQPHLCPQVQVSRERELTISGHRQRATAETAASQPADQEGVVDVGSSDSEADSKVSTAICPAAAIRCFV